MTNLLERARREGTPLLDEEAATFVWRGPEAPCLVGDFNAWDGAQSPAFNEAAPEVWAYRLPLPADAYIEYGYLQGEERLADPWNGRTTPSGMGHRNHFFYMPQAAPTRLARRARGAPRGAVTRHEALIVGGRRSVYLYQPPTPDPCSLLVVLDGQEYRRRGRLPTIVDNLVAQGRMEPVALALVHNHKRARVLEYACSEATVGFLVERVLPLARAELNLTGADGPGAYGILGASLGGLMALYAGLRAPQVFGRVLSQSGAFTFPHDTVVWDLVRHGPVPPLQIWMDVGRYEWLLDCNRRLHALLAERGYAVSYREYNAGHNYPAWRDDLWRGLEEMYRPGAGSA